MKYIYYTNVAKLIQCLKKEWASFDSTSKKLAQCQNKKQKKLDNWTSEIIVVICFLESDGQDHEVWFSFFLMFVVYNNRKIQPRSKVPKKPKTNFRL